MKSGEARPQPACALYKGIMTDDHRCAFRTLSLRAGEQVFVNGTLIEASTPCEISLSRHASVVRGAQPRRNAEMKRALTQLYQETLRAERDPGGLREARPDLLKSLNLLAAQLRTHDGQAHCASYAAAIACGDIHTALTALRGLSHIMRLHPSPAIEDLQTGLAPGANPQIGHQPLDNPQIPLAANT